MAHGMSLKKEAWCGVFAGLAGFVLCGVAGCASDQPTPSAQPVTRDQVRGHAEKVFEGLKQEEQRPASELSGSID